KTEYGHFDPQRVNLRTAALDWMRHHGFFESSGYALSVDNVFFESSRADKLRRIALIGCTHFIDDLEEVLSDPEFPRIERILFASSPVTAEDNEGADAGRPFPICTSWDEIEAEVFRERG